MNYIKIPQFPETEIIDLKHKDLILDYLKKIQPCISELNFVEMFAWRNLRKISISNYKNNLIFFLEKKGQKYFYPPFGKETEKIVKEILYYFKSNIESIKVNAFPDEKLDLIKNITDELFLEDDRDNYDYLYLCNDLVKLAGRKYDSKRNQLKKFIKNYNFEFSELTFDSVSECIEFQKKWCEIRNCNNDLSLTNENSAVLEILKNFSHLPAFGAVIKINKKIEAYTIASELNKQTVEIIVEKANPEYTGIYQAINNLFAEKFLIEYKYINRQQDTGDEGLRRAKLSYHPFKLIKKYNIGLINQNKKTL